MAGRNYTALAFSIHSIDVDRVKSVYMMFYRVLPFLTLQIQHTEDMENEIEELLQEFEEKSNRPFLHTVCFYWHTTQLCNKQRTKLQSVCGHAQRLSLQHRAYAAMPHPQHRQSRTSEMAAFGQDGDILFSPLLRGWTCCSAFLLLGERLKSSPPSHETSPVVSSGRTTHLTSQSLAPPMIN